MIINDEQLAIYEKCLEDGSLPCGAYGNFCEKCPLFENKTTLGYCAPPRYREELKDAIGRYKLTVKSHDIKDGWYYLNYNSKYDKIMPPHRCAYVRNGSAVIENTETNTKAFVAVKPGMIAGEAFPIGSPIEVSDDNINWKEAVFIGFNFGSKNPYRIAEPLPVPYRDYKYARKPQEKWVKATILNVALDSTIRHKGILSKVRFIDNEDISSICIFTPGHGLEIIDLKSGSYEVKVNVK